MIYKKRLIILITIIAALTITYAVSLIFSYGIGSGSSVYAWLDSKSAARVTRIILNAEEQEFEIVKKTNQWFVLYNNFEYPARQVRIDDFLQIFTTRSAWPVRSSSNSTHERFGVDENASRVTIYGEYSVLMDVLLGHDDIFRNETYIRRTGQNEVRSGDRSIKMYLSGPVSSWYNLRLIPESENGNLDIDGVQKLTVFDGRTTLNFNRRSRVWELTGANVENPSMNNIEHYIRFIINLEGDNFVDDVLRDDPVLNSNRLTLELGNGRVITIRISDEDETGKRLAHVSGREYVYSIPSWSAGRIFRDASSFEMQ
ncbi:MAG: DUF4340 domain-containing protein [Treponema sp.]|nr:DUF4340 domain-containing protein [Treponema sp.]